MTDYQRAGPCHSEDGASGSLRAKVKVTVPKDEAKTKAYQVKVRAVKVKVRAVKVKVHKFKVTLLKVKVAPA